MALHELKSLVARRSVRISDGAVLTIVTLVAFFYCYEVSYELEVFPNNSETYKLDLDELLLALDQLLLVSTIFCGGLFIFALRRLPEQQARRFEAGSVEPLARSAPAVSKPVGPTPAGRPSKSAEIEAAIDALMTEGVDLSRLARKDAYSRICQKATTLGANVEVGFSAPVIQRVLVRRYGPRA